MLIFLEEFCGPMCQMTSVGLSKSCQYVFPYPCLLKQNPLVTSEQESVEKLALKPDWYLHGRPFF